MATGQDPSGVTSVYTHAITWPFKALFWGTIALSLSWFLAVALGWIFQSYYWHGDSGIAVAHFKTAYAVLLKDAAGASFMADRQEIGGALLIHRSAELAYRVLFVWTGFEDVYFQAVAGTVPEGFDKFLYDIIKDHKDRVESAMWSTRLFGAKLALVLTSVPLFIAAYAVAMVDGLVLRYIRTEGGGRESAYIYHRSKYVSVMLLGTGLTVLLLLPMEFRASWVLPIMALCTGFLARIQWKYFKKYL